MHRYKVSGIMDTVEEAEFLEAQLLRDPAAEIEYEEAGGGGKILHVAAFTEFEKKFLNYETLQWILISVLLILAWGAGILLLLYTPLRRYVMRSDFRSRKLYVTSDAIVYEATRPIFLPWLGVSKFEKFILLHLITDIVLEQGCLQALFGLHSVRIESLGQGPLDAYSVSICGLTNPKQFRKVVLKAANAVRIDGSLPTSTPNRDGHAISGSFRQQPQHVSRPESSPRAIMNTSRQTLPNHYTSRHDGLLPTCGEQVLRKLEDVRSYAKKIEMLMSKQRQGLFQTDHESDC